MCSAHRVRSTCLPAARVTASARAPLTCSAAMSRRASAARAWRPRGRAAARAARRRARTSTWQRLLRPPRRVRATTARVRQAVNCTGVARQRERHMPRVLRAGQRRHQQRYVRLAPNGERSSRRHRLLSVGLMTQTQINPPAAAAPPALAPRARLLAESAGLALALAGRGRSAVRSGAGPCWRVPPAAARR